MQTNILLVTVTKVEGEAVLSVFEDATGRRSNPIPFEQKIFHDLGELGGARVYMTRSEMGSGGLGAAQQTVGQGISALAPSAVIMVGIGFGIDSQKQSIGDILVSQQLSLYELQRVGSDEKGEAKVIARGDRPHASPWLVDRFRSAELYWDEAKAKLRFGLLLSGEKLIDNKDFRRALQQLEPEAIGGEMEGAGLYTASANEKVDWILVKAICDWADGNKSENKSERQRLAAHNAASFVLFALKHAPLTVNAPTERLSSSFRGQHGSQVRLGNTPALGFLRAAIETGNVETANRQLKKILLTHAGEDAIRRGYIETVEEADNIPCEILKELERMFAEAGEQMGSLYLFKTYVTKPGEAWGGFGGRQWLGYTVGYRLDECGINSYKSHV